MQSAAGEADLSVMLPSVYGCECGLSRREKGKKKTVESLQGDSQPLAAVTTDNAHTIMVGSSC